MTEPLIRAGAMHEPIVERKILRAKSGVSRRPSPPPPPADDGSVPAAPPQALGWPEFLPHVRFDAGSVAPALLFSLPTACAGNVVLRLTSHPPQEAARAVVFVEASRFLELWQREPGYQYADLLQDLPQAWLAAPRFVEAAVQCRDSAQVASRLPQVQCLRHLAIRVRDVRRLRRRPKDVGGPQYVSIRYSERLAEAAIEPSVGSRGDSYDNALAETINGLYKAELIHRRTAWKARESAGGRDRPQAVTPAYFYE